MSPDYAQEIAANLERADASIRAARDLAATGYFDFAASRAYYAAFYASTAALLGKGVEFSKHSGVIAAVHQRLVRTGKLPRQCGSDLNWLFELRAIGDYGETRHVPQEDAERALEAAEGFLQAIKAMIGRS
jgi:uncharacterized protein (UPF0332 family)